MGQRLRYLFEDPDQPTLREDTPYPDIRKLDRSEPGWREEWNRQASNFWREQWAQPFALDAMVLRLVVEGEPPTSRT